MITHDQVSYLSGGGSGHTTIIPYSHPQHTVLYTGLLIIIELFSLKEFPDLTLAVFTHRAKQNQRL